MTLPLPRFGNFVVITNVAPIALTAYWPAAAHRSRTKHVFHAPPQPPENEEAIREQRTASTYASAAPTGRDLRLDLFRGIALWLIFLDHIPSNLVAWITIRNYGFSDATEIFVFVSGYTAAFVYGKEMRERGFVIAGAHILRRAWQIYVAHVFLFAIYLAEITYLMRQSSQALAASVLLYVLTWHFHWNLPSYPRAHWVFNPFAWHLLFVFGAWCALGGAQLLSTVLESRATLD